MITRPDSLGESSPDSSSWIVSEAPGRLTRKSGLLPGRLGAHSIRLCLLLLNPLA